MSCSSNTSGQQAVKSTAVVKYSAVRSPANFAQLQCNTDLNLPPSNWLSSSAESYGLQHVLSHSTGFCSFRMAHMFPDCMGEVDVISDAENVKKLLKIPYSRGPVSMMVHRIENTLLIDEFDIHKHLLRQAENDWVWLRKFFYEHVLHSLNEKEKSVVLKNHSRYALQQKSLVSKFLHHSLAESPDHRQTIKDGNKSCSVQTQQKPTLNTGPDPAAASSSSSSSNSSASRDKEWHRILPEPRLEEELPDPTINHKFARNVVWTFEDIQMLLGTDMPIFGGSTHPCISLRLRDMSKPISVLTGIDYWLDNLMCNVPEVVMCYHLDGIVQRYELIKTEDLPTMPDSKFSPKLIRDVAQNILSFLKSNATKAGHTYWLFKGKDEEVVKLYDLTSLCSEGLIEKGQNPFTVPVAMLLYRVARNMKMNSGSQPATIRMLLKNCLALLPKEKYPQIVTSAHYMLSDLYLPVSTDPSAPLINDGDVSEVVDEEDDVRHSTNDNDSYHEGSDDCEEDDDYRHLDHLEATNTVAVKSLCVSNYHSSLPSSPSGENHDGRRHNRRRHLGDSGSSSAHMPPSSPQPPPPIVGTIEERCNLALQHVVQGLSCLKYFKDDTANANGNDNDNLAGCSMDHNNSKPKTKCGEDEIPKMAHPFQPIPMPYSPLSCASKQRTSTSAGGGKKSSKTDSESGSPGIKNCATPVGGDSEQVLSPRALLCKPQARALPTWQQPERMDNASWNAHLKTLLYEKACLVYTTLAEQHYNSERYGSALRYIQCVMKCSCHMVGVYDKFVSFLLGRAGDCCFQLAKCWNQIATENNDGSYSLPLRTDFASTDCDDDVDKMIAFEMDSDSQHVIYNDDCHIIPKEIDKLEQLLLTSYRCYSRALALIVSPTPSTAVDNLRRRLGNIHNEIGSFFMNQAGAFPISPDAYTKQQFEELFKMAESHLEDGLKQFEMVGDNVNMALLYSNFGRLMRLMAHYHSSVEGSPLTNTEKYYYNKALSSYQSALNAVGSRKVNPIIWDTISWELSTTLYTLATLSQDYPMIFLNKSKDETEREVVELLQKALKQCDLDTPSPKQPVYQFRAAKLHHRLASLYHKILRGMTPDDSRRKNVLQLCQLNYERSARLFLVLEHSTEYLRVQLERVALAEFLAENCSNLHGKVKSLQNGLDILIQCRPMLAVMINADPNTTDSDSPQVTDDAGTEEEKEEEETTVLNITEQRLQYILKTLTKLSISHPQSRLSKLSQLYKDAYTILLLNKHPTKQEGGRQAIVSHLINVIDRLTASSPSPVS